MTSVSRSVLELRPRSLPAMTAASLSGKVASIVAAAIATLVLGTVVIVSAASGTLVPFLAVTSAAGAMVYITRTMRLRVTAELVERVGGLPRRRVPRSQIAGVRRVAVRAFGGPDDAVDLLVDAEGVCLLRLRRRLWHDEDLDRAWAHASLPVWIAPATLATFKELEQFAPGSTAVWERRPYVIAGAFIASPALLLLPLAVLITVFR